jgi:hypothetical protein
MPHDRRSQARVTVYGAELEEGSVREVEYESVADALHFACRDLAEDRRAPIEIVEDGVVVFDRAALTLECRERARGGRRPAEG